MASTRAVPVLKEELSEAKRRLLEQWIKDRGPTPADTDRIQPRVPGVPIPISAEQHRIWLHALANADVPLYNESITIHRRGAFNLEILSASLEEILRRHEVWRTSFVFRHEQLIQMVHPPPRVQLPFLDLSHLAKEQQEAEAVRMAAEDAARPIALDGDLLFRARVVRFGPEYHRLYLTLHHIIFDGVSIYRILMPELALIYESIESGTAPPLPAPQLQYADYAIWREHHKSSPAVADQLKYWKGQLAGKLPVLMLPTDRARRAQMSHRGSMERFQLPADLVAELRKISRAHGVTLYMTLLAAFKTLLFRYSGQQDLIVGGVTDARRRAELESLMGYFLDTFALRTAPMASKSFAEYLLEVRTVVLEAIAASEVPFDEIVQAIQPKRNSSYHPIFQAFFSIEPPAEPFAAGWDLTQMDVSVTSAKFDLYAELDERPDHMAGRFLYNSELFEPSTIRRMISHYVVLLEGICKAPDQQLGVLPLLTPDEITQMVSENGWNATARPFPSGTLHGLIEAQARRSPDAVAAVFHGMGWTYAELLLRAEVLASALRDAGATRGSIVALFHTRSLDLIAGMIAIMKTGAAYLPLDPAAPEERVMLCLEDAQPVTILTETSLEAALIATTVPLLFTDRIEGHSSDPADLPDEGRPGDLAYLIHTSGSTGRPKGVEISHASLINLLTSMQREPGFCSEDVLLAVTTVSFDIAALEIFLPLISGGRIVFASRVAVQDPTLLSALINSSGCSVMQATPATWRSLVASGWEGARSADGSIRPLKILCGGEPMSRELADQLLATRAEVWNMYGPTETTIWSTVHRVRPGTAAVPIGKPIANTTTFLLDPQRQFLPVGVPGNLFLGGAGLAQGYRGLPGLSAERFIHAEAFGDARLYDTGDVCVRREDGNLEWIGRRDNQVKVRGFRVELEAVEAAVLRHPQVEAAAVRVWPDPTGGMRLSAYLVGRSGPPPDQAELRRFLAPIVPDYMFPSDVMEMQMLPLTSNGKLDRSSLPPPTSGKEISRREEALTEVQQRLTTIWAELLPTQAIGIDDDFFDIGGHSLLIATLQHRVVAAFGQRLTMAALFHAPTIRQQGALLEEGAMAAITLPGLLKLQPKGSQPPLFWLHPPPEINRLTEALGVDHPLFGVALTKDDLDALKEEPDIREIALRHAKTILQAQSTGPYFLAGFCTGGIVAFETAAQIEAAGGKVALLILVDSQNPVFYKRIDSLAVELSKFRFYLRQKYTGTSTGKTLRRRIRSRLIKIWNYERMTTEMEESEQITNLAAYRYKPNRYKGDVLLLRPVDRPNRMNHLLGWQAIVGGNVLAKDVEGHHEELWEPVRIRGVAREIAYEMARAQRRQE